MRLKATYGSEDSSSSEEAVLEDKQTLTALLICIQVRDLPINIEAYYLLVLIRHASARERRLARQIRITSKSQVRRNFNDPIRHPDREIHVPYTIIHNVIHSQAGTVRSYPEVAR